MDSPVGINRLPYGLIIVLAFGLLVASLLLVALHMDAQSGHKAGFLLYHLSIAAFVGLFYAMPLLLWLLIIWLVFQVWSRWRGRTAVALLPSLVLFVYSCADWVLEPPSLQRYFRVAFDADLPADARNIDLVPSTLGDNSIYFCFSCSKESTERLIRESSLEKCPWPLGYLYIDRRLNCSLRQQPDIDLLSFARDGPYGHRWILTTHRGMTDVLIVKSSMQDGHDDELTGSAP